VIRNKGAFSVSNSSARSRGMHRVSFTAKFVTEGLRATLIITILKINPDLFTADYL